MMYEDPNMISFKKKYEISANSNTEKGSGLDLSYQYQLATYI